MLTRLKVNGFKNLIDIDLRFGPFTCIAGGNGVGKSNIFDAIQFLSLLADKPLAEAASSIRSRRDSGGDRGSFVRSIFHQVGQHTERRISFEVEMIIPKHGLDELGQPAEATFNFLRYILELELEENDIPDSKGPIRVLREELLPISKGSAHKHLLFEHSYKWRSSVIKGKRNVPYVSTKEEEGETLINLHQDGGSSGKPRPFLAKSLPRTVLSSARYASETPTVLLAKQEMMSWRLLHLEPSSLRNPDELDKYSSLVSIGSDGAHLAATVYRLAHFNQDQEYEEDFSIYTQLANSLSELVPNVREVTVDKDDKRQLLTLQVISKDGTVLPAKSLSDGTLRFLALAVLDMDFTETGLICLEEPENGIFPDRIPMIIDLLGSIPVDAFEEDGPENPLRQVIVNTHSPRVVLSIDDESLVFVDNGQFVVDGRRFQATKLQALAKTWRTEKGGAKEISKGQLLAFFNDDSDRYDALIKADQQQNARKTTKIKNRADLDILKAQTKLNF